MENRAALIKILEGPRPVLADGAMGTMLNLRGVEFDTCMDALNIQKPSLVADIHRMYIEAGAQIIETNTFGANRYKLARHGLEEQSCRDQQSRGRTGQASGACFFSRSLHRRVGRSFGSAPGAIWQGAV
jgi:methionine synthase I (cobalamin-dependent)